MPRRRQVASGCPARSRPHFISATQKLLSDHNQQGYCPSGGEGNREVAMRYGTTANAQQVEAMGHVVSRYCKHIGIEPGTPEAERIASIVLALHEVGVRSEADLLKALIVPKSRLPRGAHWG
jgi:hypothetical protein